MSELRLFVEALIASFDQALPSRPQTARSVRNHLLHALRTFDKGVKAKDAMPNQVLSPNEHQCKWIEDAQKVTKPSEGAAAIAASCWCWPETENKPMDPVLGMVFAKVLTVMYSRPWLGNATTRELEDELEKRMRHPISAEDAYRSFDGPRY